MPVTVSGTSITFNDSTVQTSAAGLAPDVQTFNSSGTWTKPAGRTMAYIQVWSGGGGGGRSPQNAGCGAGGGYTEMVMPISYLNASVSITVGAGGTGATTSAAGGDGGASSVPMNTTYMGVSTLQAIGGVGGRATGNGDVGAAPGGPGTVRPTMNFAPATFLPIYNPPAAWNGGFGGGYDFGGCTLNNVTGGASVFGGGGGSRTGSGGTSVYGGAGGVGTSGAGTQPGGGGGSSLSSNQNGGNGGAGRVVITCW